MITYGMQTNEQWRRYGIEITKAVVGEGRGSHLSISHQCARHMACSPLLGSDEPPPPTTLPIRGHVAWISPHHSVPAHLSLGTGPVPWRFPTTGRRSRPPICRWRIWLQTLEIQKKPVIVMIVDHLRVRVTLIYYLHLQ